VLLKFVWQKKQEDDHLRLRRNDVEVVRMSLREFVVVCNRRASAWLIQLSRFAFCFLAISAAGQAQESRSEVVGVWNIQAESRTERPTGGVRNVILVVSETNGELSAKITNLRNDFVPLADFSYNYESKRIQLWYGAYHYNLKLDGARLEGTVYSPAGELTAHGARQAEGDFRYRGMSVQPFETNRTGVIGHLNAFLPPEEALDPNRWILDRIESPDEWALVVGDGALAIGFSNASEFESELRRLAGLEVGLEGVWIGERLKIVDITFPAVGGGH